MNKSQATSSVLMVRPVSFAFNEQTAVTNTFQNRPDTSNEVLHILANQEFDTMVNSLKDQGIHVTVFEDIDEQRKPDAVFPNNWFSAWPDGKVFLYPMATESRRIERSYNALQNLAKDFTIKQVVDMSDAEEHRLALESTGVMIFDHINKIVYGCISPRCDADLFTTHANELGYKPILFHSYGTDGTAVYHTNVMMGIQSTTAVICAESITDEMERALVLNTLKETGHEVVEITQAQMSTFCGNVLELQNNDGELFLAMSKTAFENFTDEQKTTLSKDKVLLPFDISTIETVGGGSVRCMLGEVFLPRKHAPLPSESSKVTPEVLVTA
jgi:hypothetical protein